MSIPLAVPFVVQARMPGVVQVMNSRYPPQSLGRKEVLPFYSALIPVYL